MVCRKPIRGYPFHGSITGSNPVVEPKYFQWFSGKSDLNRDTGAREFFGILAGLAVICRILGDDLD